LVGERLRNIGREVLLFIACAIFTGTVGLLVADTVILPRYIRKGEQIEVPQVTDLTPDQARRALSKKGLRMRLQNPRWDTRIVKGNVMVQNPAAGSKVKSGRTVYVVPSKGTRSFTVPNVIGKKLRQAHLFVQQANLTVAEVIEEPSNDVREGEVARQDPAAGLQVGAGADVILYVSDGPPGELIPMIDLVGEPLKQVRTKIEAAGLRVGNVRYEFTTSYSPNLVIRQVPEAGADIRQGSRVSLTISKL
jgi:eukaryotic-like serine/threonine-protein kinase